MVMKGANDVMCVRVDASQTGSAVSFLSIDLFEGAYTVESAPPHTPPDPLTELEKCHFYFRRLKGMNWAVFGTGSVRLTHRADFFIPLGKMRIDNVSIRTQGAFTITVAGASFPPASITLDVFGRSNIGIIVTADTGEHLLSSYLGQTALLQANDNAETYIDISADL